MPVNTFTTKHDLAKLPRWARVALVARCVRRVLPLYRSGFPEMTEKHKQAIEQAITIAVRAAAEANFATIDAAAEAHEAVKLADRAAARPVSSNVAQAAIAAVAAARGDALPDMPPPANPAAAAARDAAAAARDAAAAGGAPVSAALWRDFQLLLAIAQQEHWTNDTPVSQEVFGPWWPDGAPEWWTPLKETDDGEEIVLEIEIPDGATDAEAIEFVKELVDKADDLHRAYGGHGLKVSDLRATGEVELPAEVLQ